VEDHRSMWCLHTSVSVDCILCDPFGGVVTCNRIARNGNCPTALHLILIVVVVVVVVGGGGGSIHLCFASCVWLFIFNNSECHCPAGLYYN
jgi:hypothetical protein